MISDKEIEKQVDSLLKELTIEEKFKLMVGYFRFQTNIIRRLGIKTFKMTDGPLGIAQHSSMLRKNTRFAAGINLAASSAFIEKLSQLIMALSPVVICKALAKELSNPGSI